jgi:hypothetical protein
MSMRESIVVRTQVAQLLRNAELCPQPRHRGSVMNSRRFN